MPTYRQLLGVIITCLVVNGAHAETCDTPTTLRYGTHDRLPFSANRQKTDSALAELIEKQTQIPVRLTTYESPHKLVIAIRHGELDVSRLKLMEYLQVRKAGAAIEAFAALDYTRPEGDGIEYRSILITHINSAYKTVESLKGKSLALVSLSSASGYKVPNALFTAVINSSLDDYFSKQVFVGGHLGGIEAVLSGRVDAAFVASTALDHARGNVAGDPSNLTVLWASPPLKVGPLVYRTTLCDPLKSDIRKALFAINDPAIATKLKKEGSFIQVIPANDQDYDEIVNIIGKPQP